MFLKVCRTHKEISGQIPEAQASNLNKFKTIPRIDLETICKSLRYVFTFWEDIGAASNHKYTYKNMKMKK